MFFIFSLLFIKESDSHILIFLCFHTESFSIKSVNLENSSKTVFLIVSLILYVPLKNKFLYFILTYFDIPRNK